MNDKKYLRNRNSEIMNSKMVLDYDTNNEKEKT